MPSARPEAARREAPSSRKAEWRKPTVTALDTWEAQAQDGVGTDSGSMLS